jgi:nitroreductase
MERSAPAKHPISALLKQRWSPRAFADRDVETAKLQSLFEAARWAASSYNAQPWHFVIATRKEPEAFQRILGCLVEFNQGWAKNAPVIGISVAKLHFDHDDNLNRHAYHDVGQAAASLAIEATAQALQVHQMAGILVDKAREVLSIPAGYDPVAGLALGYPGDPQSLPDPLRERELASRQRKEASSFVHDGSWNKEATFLK